MKGDIFGAKSLETFFPSLATIPSVQTALKEEFGEHGSAIIAKMQTGESLSNEEHNTIDDLVQNNSVVADSYDGWNSSCDDTFSINVMQFGSVFWIEAQENNDIGYFGTLSEAQAAAELNYQDTIDEASEHKAEELVCPICEDKECQRHLLACFDESGDEGEFGVGLLDGVLNEVQEIGKVLERARLAWVQSVRATGKPKVPSWIMNDPGLRQYFDALGGTDVDKYDTDEDAASDLAVNTDIGYAREEFLREDLTRCGWLDQRTEKEINYGGFPAATTYLYWWANDPREIVEEFKAKLQNLLFEANGTK